MIRLLLAGPGHRSQARSLDSVDGRRPRASPSAQPCIRQGKAARSLGSSASAAPCSCAWPDLVHRALHERRRDRRAAPTPGSVVGPAHSRPLLAGIVGAIEPHQQPLESSPGSRAASLAEDRALGRDYRALRSRWPSRSRCRRHRVLGGDMLTDAGVATAFDPDPDGDEPVSRRVRPPWTC